MNQRTLSLLLVLCTTAFYLPVVKNAFINFDDNRYIYENAHVRAGLTWDTVKWAFTSLDESNWHPLTWLSHALDWQLFGANAGAHHFVNALLHSANAVLLFLLLANATGFLWRSWMVAALFAWHPINVESVAWAAERKNVLSMLFFMVTLLAYDWYVRKPGVRRYVAVMLGFALGLMAKPQIITLPFVLLLWDYWPLRRFGHASTGGVKPSFWSLVWEKVPLFALAGLSAVVTLQAQHSGNAVRTFLEYSLPVRLENAAVAYARYVLHAFWPWPLTPMYPHVGNSLPHWQAAASLSLLLAGSFGAWLLRRHGYVLIGWLWFVGTLFPMIGVIQVGEQAMADRYAYISLLGIFVISVWGVTDLVGQRRLLRQAMPWIAAWVLGSLGMATWHQLGYWRNSETLWSYTLRHTERNYMAHSNLARALAAQGRADEAIVQFEAAERYFAYPPGQIFQVGVYEQNHGQRQKAAEQFARVVRESRDPALRAAAFTNLGMNYLQMGDYAAAKENYESAILLNTDNDVARIGLGLLAGRRGDWAEAVNEFSRAVAIHRTDVALLLLASALRQTGRQQEARTAAEQAQALASDWTQAQQTVKQLLSY
ncbi:MAG TPA: tetratricopeptide repeat protein [Terriglobales bacterium]